MVRRFKVRKLANLLAALAIAAAGAAAQSSGGPQSQTSTGKTERDPSAMKAMRTIVHAEIVYFTSFPQVGFTCTLADLGGSGDGQPNPHKALLISSDLADGRMDGYVYKLTGCARNPAISFHLVATPEGNGGRAFCADETGVIRYSAAGEAATCLTSGTRAR
jgi:hypothetical protein